MTAGVEFLPACFFIWWLHCDQMNTAGNILMKVPAGLAAKDPGSSRKEN
jgi:hypothetical protein